MLIRSVETFWGAVGERIEKIERLTLLDAESGILATEEQIKKELKDPEPPVVLLGVISVPIGVHAPSPDGRTRLIDVRPQEIRFPIDSPNLKEAFEKFEELSNQVIEELRRNQEEKAKNKSDGIIVPNAAQSEAINNLKLVTP